jgi:hypothetical protein
MMRKIAIALVATLLVHGSARAAEPSPAAAAAPKPAAAAPAQAPIGKSSKRTVDRLQLETTSITGNRELPKVMNIVPWKAAEPPGGPDRPLNSLVEDVLSPLDRDEFRREITYYRDLTGQSAPVVAPGATQP